jgi:predicted pyridoxine 5'-phosphate oxidase superfamily flavin-nucleotide-binding protein
MADSRTLHIGATPPEHDPLADALTVRRSRETHVGVLLIDLATRRRLRVNGTVEPTADGGLTIRVRRAYWICPKYIQRRQIIAPAHPTAAPRPVTGLAAPSTPRTTALTARQRDWMARADTFFIASAHPTDGADVSHRGGSPGFVQLSREHGGVDVLTFPDYPGNNMFNTFGNLAVDPRAGLLFVGFEDGATLQLTGDAEVQWEHDAFGAFPGAERAVRFRVSEALESAEGTKLRWRLSERSPFNPPAQRGSQPLASLTHDRPG